MLPSADFGDSPTLRHQPDLSMIEHSWGNFWSLVRRTFVAGNDVDMYDLRGDVTSCDEWQVLVHEEAQTSLALIDYIVANQEALRLAATSAVACADALSARVRSESATSVP